MLIRILAGGSMAFAGALFAGLLLFGAELPSYLVTSAGTLRDSVQESVPLEFELQRARRDMLDSMMPEIHSKIRLVAHEEVEVKSLKNQIRRNEQQLSTRAHRLQTMRAAMQTRTVSSSDQLGLERETQLRLLRHTFDQYKESENLLAMQRELLRAREISLQAAKNALEDYRSQKALIEQKIESLLARHQMVEARTALATTSNNKGHLARIDQLLNEVDKRIEVASRILDHESEMLPIDSIPSLDEADLLAEVDKYLKSP